MISRFELDPRLAAGSRWVAELPESRLLQSLAGEVPWWILVPRVMGAVEWLDLPDSVLQAVQQESLALQRALQAAFPGTRLNVGKLGNVVAQLHLHHVARSADDPLWPGPVWGRTSGDAAPETLTAARLALLRRHWPDGVPIHWRTPESGVAEAASGSVHGV